MEHASENIKDGHDKHNFTSSTVSKSGTQSFFPWSPRFSQNLIINPSPISTKVHYKTQQPLFKTKPNLTSRLQEISIDQTWFKKNESAEAKTDPQKSAELPNEKEDVADIPIPVADGGISINQIDVKDKCTAARTQNQLAYESKKQNSSHFSRPCHRLNRYVNTEREADETLNKIEKLILTDESLLDFNKVADKSLGERKARSHHDLKLYNKACCSHDSLGPDITNTCGENKHCDYARTDSRNASVCSSCSVDSSVPSRSRCSSGDGCSSMDCDGTHNVRCDFHSQSHLQRYVEPLPFKSISLARSSDGNGENSFKMFRKCLNSYCNCDTGSLSASPGKENIFHQADFCNCNTGSLSTTPVKENRFPQAARGRSFCTCDGVDADVTDSQAHTQCIWHNPGLFSSGWQLLDKYVHTTGQTSGLSSGKPKAGIVNRDTALEFSENPVSQMQLMFYIVKLQISKYGEIKAFLESQQLSLTSQAQSVNRLIQCVVLLSVKLNQQNNTLDHLTEVLRRQAVERQSLQQRQTIILAVVLGLVIFYVLHMEGVQRKIMAIFRMFGIARQLKSLNRTRKRVSEIWRDIPPLLTNFWRIFIFKGRTE